MPTQDLSSWIRNDVIAILLAANLVAYKLCDTIPYREQWKDFISVVGTFTTIVGFGIALISLWYAYKQLVAATREAEAAKEMVGRAESAAEAAKRASDETAGKYQSHFFRHAVSIAQRFFGQGAENVDGNWSTAKVYFQLVEEYLTHILTIVDDEDADEIIELIQLLREMVSKCDRLASGELIRFPRKNWDQLTLKFWQVTRKHNRRIPSEEP